MTKTCRENLNVKIMTDIYIYIYIEREREKNRIFGVNGFEFYEVPLDIRTLKNIFYIMPGFSGHNKNNMPLLEWQST